MQLPSKVPMWRIQAGLHDGFLLPNLTRLSKAGVAFESIVAKIKNGIDYMNWHQGLFGRRLRAALRKYAEEIFGELGSIKKGII